MYRYIDVGTHLWLPNSTRSRIEMGLFCSGEPPRPAPFLLLYYYFFWMYCTHVIEVENIGSCPMNYSKCNYKQQFSMCQEPFLEKYALWSQTLKGCHLYSVPKSIMPILLLGGSRIKLPSVLTHQYLIELSLIILFFSRSQHIVKEIWEQSKMSLIKWDVTTCESSTDINP